MTTPTMKCTSRADLLAIPAVMFGFHPAESVVIMGMRGSTVEFTARIDLDWHLHGTEQIVAQLMSAAEHVSTEDFIILGYGADPDLAFLSVTELISLLGARHVREALVTDGTSYWSLDDGEPLQFDFDSSAVAAQAVYEGRLISDSREAMVAQVEDWAPATEEEVAAQESYLRGVARPDRLFSRLLESARPLAAEEALQLALYLGEQLRCDRLVGNLTVERAKRIWPNLTAARRVAPPSAEINTIAVLAMAAWLRGGGAEYTSCVEQLETRAPEHPVSQVLARMHHLGIPPRMWSECE